MEPRIVIAGMEAIIERDILKHKELVKAIKSELDSYRVARSHEIKRKKHFLSLVGRGKFSDEALESSMADISINIRHLSDKCKSAEEKLAHHTLIVDTLTEQLRVQEEDMAELAKYHGTANRLG